MNQQKHICCHDSLKRVEWSYCSIYEELLEVVIFSNSIWIDNQNWWNDLMRLWHFLRCSPQCMWAFIHVLCSKTGIRWFCCTIQKFTLSFLHFACLLQLYFGRDHGSYCEAHEAIVSPSLDCKMCMKRNGQTAWQWRVALMN